MPFGGSSTRSPSLTAEAPPIVTSSDWSTSLSDSSMARSTVFRSSRTLPGQPYDCSRFIAAGATPRTRFLNSVLYESM